MDMQVDDREVTGNPGDSIWVPRGTDHGFTTTNEDAHVLNGYAPGGVEQIMVAWPRRQRAASSRPRTLRCRPKAF